jgi:hypothetical protein
MTSPTDLLARYKQARAVSFKVNNTIAGRLPKDVLNEGAKHLGLLHNNTLVLDNEAEMAALMDYCIHDIRRQGRNAVECYLEEASLTADSPESKYVEALRQASFSLWHVEEVERGVGVRVRDVLRGAAHFLVDVGLSTSARVGGIVAARLVSFDGLTMTTGAPLGLGAHDDPARAASFEQALQAMHGEVLGNPSKQLVSEFNRMLIRLCIEQGSGSRTRLSCPPLGAKSGAVPESPGPRERIGRNDPCPCGSGKKFKVCCGRR